MRKTMTEYAICIELDAPIKIYIICMEEMPFSEVFHIVIYTEL